MSTVIVALPAGSAQAAATASEGSSCTDPPVPSGSTAVSPPMCIGNGMPLAKTMMRGTAKGTVAFTPYDETAGKQMATMQLNGSTTWSLTPPVNVLPGAVSGWHVMQFTYVAGGKGNGFQIYDFGVDPHMKLS